MKASPRGRKTYAINLNQYTNWHFQLKNNLKRSYAAYMADQLEGIEIESPVEITYTVHKPTRRTLDKMNVISITSKFLMDAITEFGCWEDDNDDIIKDERLKPTIHNPKDPHVEVVIKTIK